MLRLTSGEKLKAQMAQAHRQLDTGEDQTKAVFRLHVALSFAAMPDLVGHLRTAGQSPKLFIYRQEGESPGLGAIVMDFERINESAADALATWLERIQGVFSVEFEWRSPKKIEAVA